LERKTEKLKNLADIGKSKVISDRSKFMNHKSGDNTNYDACGNAIASPKVSK
jgi:hypothetical protein